MVPPGQFERVDAERIRRQSRKKAPEPFADRATRPYFAAEWESDRIFSFTAILC